jgi:hypothetical protein
MITLPTNDPTVHAQRAASFGSAVADVLATRDVTRYSRSAKRGPDDPHGTAPDDLAAFFAKEAWHSAEIATGEIQPNLWPEVTP